MKIKKKDNPRFIFLNQLKKNLRETKQFGKIKLKKLSSKKDLRAVFFFLTRFY